MIQQLEKLRTALTRTGTSYEVVSVQHPGEVPMLVQRAEDMHWRVQAVWRGEASIINILFRYEAP